MKKFVLASILMASLPFLVWAQSADDLYYIPKKKVEKKVEKKEMVTSVPVNTSLGSTVVVKDAKGDVRDVDEYNRRYTSRENTFSIENDTLYIEEKPYDEQGEWVNGFDGSETDYEYAMRIVRFRNPRFAIPVSSPLYWDVLYTLPSWEWNVYDDGFYAYAFPTYSNPLWWNWRFNYSWSWGWSSPWHYSHWYGPGYWHHSYWHHHHHHYPHYGWGGVGGYWGGGHGWNGSSARNPGIHAGRYQNNNRVATGASNRRPTLAGNRTSRDAYLNRTSQNDKRNGSVTRRAGRVVKSNDASSSVRPQRNAVRSRNQGTAEQKENASVRSRSTYTRPAQGKSSTYDRQSSTRTTVKRTTPTYQKKSEATERNSYQSRSSRSSESRSDSYNSSSSSSSSSSGSYSSGSSSSRSSGFGSSRSSGGGGSRGGGRR